MGVAVWPMIELEADDALATAARLADEDERVEKVLIWTPDKDLAQCVRGDRVLQVDRKGRKIRDARDIREKFGVEPALIPDFLALVGDAADGYPGIEGIGAVGAARLLNRYGPIETSFRKCPGRSTRHRKVVQAARDPQIRCEAVRNVDELRWQGPTSAFAAWTERVGAPKLLERSLAAQAKMEQP